MSRWFWIVVLLFALFSGDAAAFSTVLKVSREAKGSREILSFNVPPGAARPRVELADPQTLRLSVPGLLALPSAALEPAASQLIKSFKVEDLRGDEMGLNITIGLKKPNLAFRDSLGQTDPITGTPYRLEIDTPVAPTGVKDVKLLESRALAGRDGTLVIFSHTGTAQVESAVDLGAHLVRLHWRGGSLDHGWRVPKPEGLAERLLAYAFPDQVEVEIAVHPDVTDVRFHQEAGTGLYIVALSGKSQLGRQTDIEEIFRQRKEVLAAGEVRPLNRLDPTFIIRPDRTLTLNKRVVDEGYYLKNAQEAAKDRRYGRARGYLKRLLTLFPDTPNRQLIDFYLWDLAYNMEWKPGWLLSGLRTLLAKYPNTVHYPHYRLLELHLLNRSGLYEDASTMLWDPNLPRDNVRVWLERGHAAVGLARTHVGDQADWQGASEYLQKVLELTGNKGDASAEAHYLLAQIAHYRRDGKGASAPRVLDGLAPEHLAYISNRPDWLMAVADIYYENRDYEKAFKYYGHFLDSYPSVERIVPWAILRAAESSWELAKLEPAKTSRRGTLVGNARFLFTSLQEKYPKTDAAVWGRVFQLRLDEGQDVVTRLKKINQVMKSIRLPDALSELFMVKAELQGSDKRYEGALVTLNRLIATTLQVQMIDRAVKVKQEFLLAGMKQDLEQYRPEHAILLVELHGENLHKKPELAPARVMLAEALLRIGLTEQVPAFLEGIDTPVATSLRRLSRAFAEGRWPEVMAPPDAGPAVKAMSEAHPAVGTGAPPVEERISATDAAKSGAPAVPLEGGAESDASAVESVTVEEARVRLDEAGRLLDSKEWEGIMRLLEKLPDNILDGVGQEKRLRLLAKAEEGRARYPFAVQYLEDLLSGKKMADGSDYYWYANVLQQWKGDAKALPAFKRVSEEATEKEVQALAHVRIGDIMQRSGEYAGAREHYLDAERLLPDSALAKASRENAAQLGMAMEVAK
ncbi:MAG: tetratricopeptide repeat protein [Magnetococcus sp. YQC-3]